jgi:hypothetical protein
MMSSGANLDALHAINRRALLGDDSQQNLPALTLADGSQIQTGTVGALLKNIRDYDQMLTKQQDVTAEGVYPPLFMKSHLVSRDTKSFEKRSMR